jgi:hypothetical protein
VSAIAVLFGAYEQDGLHALFSVPEGAFELAFAIYLIAKGFRPSPILDDARFDGGNGPRALRLRRNRLLGHQPRKGARRMLRSLTAKRCRYQARPRETCLASARRQETAFHGYSRRDLTRMLGWGVLEIFWYHPLLAVWRTSGTIRLALGRRPGWGEIPREALEEAPAGALTPLTR